MPGSMTAKQLRALLAGTVMPSDPLDVDYTHIGNRMPEALIERLRPDLRAAGVLIPVFERPEGLTVLLTERSHQLKHHAGQVSFPGGAMEEGDADISATALREAEEEVGIPRTAVDVLGYINPLATITAYAMTPIVGLVDNRVELTLDPTEVDDAFEVPFDFLQDESNAAVSERVYEGFPLRVLSYEYEGHTIWGATAGIIVTLNRLLKGI